jgi:FkbH-like protein
MVKSETNNDSYIFEKCAWQPFLFKPLPERHNLAALRPSWPVETIKLRVHRNHAFEHLASACEKWFNWWGKTLDIQLGDYDDSFNFSGNADFTPDVELLWIDLGHYSSSDVSSWLIQRVCSLRLSSVHPIMLVTTGGDDIVRESLHSGLAHLAGTSVFCIEREIGHKGIELFSARSAQFAGTRLSDQAMVLVARELGCKWIPSAINVVRKAVVVDLDNTLYSGVLGEDGPNGLNFSEGYLLLQEALLQLKKQGYLLAVASKNEETDARSLFHERSDFRLRWSDFSAYSVNWNDKVSGLSKICEKLNIGISSIVFIDDNAGELAAVGSSYPEIGLIHAHSDPIITMNSLLYFPGLWKSRLNEEDKLRAEDIAANAERRRFAESNKDPNKYLYSLKIVLDFYLNNANQISRMVELSQKTNQFNLSLSRFNEVDISNYLRNPMSSVVTIGLSDRLSNSGLIGLLVLNRENQIVRVEELAISCRALGRGLEHLMIGNALKCALNGLLSKVQLEFRYVKGSRNAPARLWLERECGSELAEQGLQKLFWPEKKNCKDTNGIDINFHTT